jgi:tetratricopeptide (TPR) repeat protein/serine phosphatase RsbU (regulator of sigma subunit)
MKKLASIIFSLNILFIINAYSGTNIDSLEKKLGESLSVKEIQILIELAEAYRNKNNEKSLKYSFDALKISKENKLTSFEAEANYSIGFTYYLMNKYDEAIIYLENAITLRKKLKDDKGLSNALNRLGNVYQLKNNYEKALELYREALTISEQIDDKKEIARTLTNLGSIYRIQGAFEKAIDYHLKALNFYELDSSKEGMAWTYLNIARLYNEMGEFEKALFNTNRSLKLYESLNTLSGSKTGITLCLSEIASIYQKTGKLDEALDYRKKLLNINYETNNQYGIATTIADIGKIYYDMKKYNEALKYLQQSVELKSKINDETGLASIYRYIGNSFIQFKDYNKALNYLKMSLKYAEKQNLRSELKETYLSLSNFFLNINNYREAYSFLKLYSDIKDSLNLKEITKLELQYEFNRKQSEFEFEQAKREALHKTELQKQKIIKNSFIIGFILMVALVFLIFKNYQEKKRSNIALQLKNEEILQQKEEIQSQRDEIERQRDIATAQRDHIQNQNKIITDSIHYAERIQAAVFPQKKELSAVFHEYFILFKPRDIVSGDFYWFTRINNKIIITVADCTGHGVPGAFMSMLGLAFINEIVSRKGITNTKEIMNAMRLSIIEALHQTGEYGEAKDGIDMALLTLDLDTGYACYTGANSPLYLIRDNQVIDYKPDRIPIGIFLKNGELEDFTEYKFKFQKGDLYYMFTDGYVDQFGGPSGQKFKYAPFRDLLLENHKHTMEQQKIIIEQKFNEWKGNRPQLDDVLVFGLKIT